jgi:Zn-finger nucleic acid-binding protein
MSRACPVCDSQPLKAVRAGDVELDQCPRCEGLWFDAGELELFPDRPSVKEFLAGARLAAGRCRKGGHRVPKGMARCATCGGGAACCPGCGGVLSMVAAQTCVIDVCATCHGVWLDKGELELLAGAPAAAPAAANPGWEIPSAAPASLADPWAGPGSVRPVDGSIPPSSRAPFICGHCGAGLTVYSAFAAGGETYCAACRPSGSVGAHELPTDRQWEQSPGRAGVSASVAFEVVAALVRAIAFLLR